MSTSFSLPQRPQQLTTQDRIILGEVVLEEALLLRVRDKALADAIRRVLRDEERVEDHLRIVMDTPVNADAAGNGGNGTGNGVANGTIGTQTHEGDATAPTAPAPTAPAVSEVNGTLEFQGKKYQLTKLNMVSVTECYKSYDDINLVKTDDIGQVLLVGDLLESEAETGEVRDGVTRPMRNARGRVFRQPIQVSRQTVEVVERDLFQVLDGKGPAGYIYRDYEEVWDGEKWVVCIADDDAPHRSLAHSRSFDSSRAADGC
jgi:hypothetical protein